LTDRELDRALRIEVLMGSVLRLTVALAAAGGAAAASAQGATSSQLIFIYQQRTADGHVVLSDRPLADAVIQRRWDIPLEDPLAARQRREDAQREARLVTERVQRQIDAQLQRSQLAEIERWQLAEAQARRDAELARADADRQPGVVFVPRFVSSSLPRFPHPRPPRLPRPRPPEPKMFHGRD
jgi:hypothetical protein